MSYTHFKFELDGDGIALITFDSPNVSMNVLSASVMAELGQIVDKIGSDDAIKGAVITSGKKAFCAGADLSELGSGMMDLKGLSEEEAKQKLFDTAFRLNSQLRALETCGKPVAAAINGLALGGGFEVTLACHYRVMANDTGAKLGLPEALVGVLPGGGGTQRLPRLVGVMNAAPVMLQGKQLDADTAKQQGVVHEVAPVSEIVAKAKELVKANPLGSKQPWDQDKFKIPGGGPFHPAGMQIFGGASPMLLKETYGNYPAQRYILSCVYEGLQVPIDAGLRIESRYFTKLLMRPESRNMIRSLFLSKQSLDKGSRRPAGQEKSEIKKIGVIGAGFMGAGITTVSAQAGIEVVLIDVNQEGADKGKQHAVDFFAKGVKRGKITEDKAKKLADLITATTDYGALKDVDLVVEAVFENSELKAEITKKAEAVMPKGAIFGSNTSTIPISSLAKASERPDNFIGIHFFSPVEKMNLVELIVGEKTGDLAVSRAIDFVGKIKKTPIVVADTRGFYANRCVMRYIEQGMYLLTEGVKPALIENAAKMAGMPVGPLSLQDEVAIDLGYKVLQQTKKDLGDQFEDTPNAQVIEKMYELGRYGRKNGKGFYVYEEGGKRLWDDLDQFAPNGELLPADQQPSVGEIKDRILYAQAIEAARTMAEGIVEDPREADVGSILGWGFAPYTGGVISFIDTVGTEKFVTRADELAKKYGKPFEVPQLLRDMAAKKETFYARFAPKKAA
ncbi:MAG TPA: 3-hydroxyacyl-CoA dehydrogenase [Oceanicaulis sp.]|uniref:3-hydroxyacyl-CoA dehydrogenase n=1 Tax=Glycocaulis albus TaxID=1382801 RepID=A0ABQ1XUC5_9PROT|nr:3-hydroxyacyl-CoA dehydrogenase NAD-binding domain-containing protein [Glycocaulis albus]MBV5258847.1 3-hydroxyacyl-CoA dehydrogenase [Synechococcus moorigangaii CMS01]GGH03177.1 3-hydroxyacyl-CoA dehydrogenase [Glycocaulis albus]HCY54852.1 3-hydroxyacyl-CoA dehydrogenase [Oceanicaulis sp.]